MRKLSVLLLAMITIASLSFAEIKFTGGWGDVEFRAAESLGANTNLVTDIGNNWGGQGDFGLTLQAKGDKGGLYAGVQFNGGNSDILYACDDLFIWMNPVDGLKVSVGPKVGTGTLRVHSADDIFTQFDTAGNPAIVAEFSGIQNLYLGAAVQSVMNNYGATGYMDLLQSYATTQVAADYTIAGFGRIRAQYIGDGDTTNTNNGTVEAAVLTNGLVKGLTAELGVKAPLVTNAVYQANLYLSYASGALWTEAKAYNKIATATGADFYGMYSVEGNYNLSGPYTAGLYVEDDFTANTSNAITVKPYAQIQHGLDNGYIRGRVYFQFGYTAPTSGTATSTWKVPVYLEYCFW